MPARPEPGGADGLRHWVVDSELAARAAGRGHPADGRPRRRARRRRRGRAGRRRPGDRRRRRRSVRRTRWPRACTTRRARRSTGSCNGRAGWTRPRASSASRSPCSGSPTPCRRRSGRSATGSTSRPARTRDSATSDGAERPGQGRHETDHARAARAHRRRPGRHEADAEADGGRTTGTATDGRRRGRSRRGERSGLYNRQAVQVGVATSLAIMAGELISPARWYWAVIAAFVVFAGTSSRGDVLSRGWARVVGTAGGLVAGMLLAFAVAGNLVREPGAAVRLRVPRAVPGADLPGDDGVLDHRGARAALRRDRPVQRRRRWCCASRRRSRAVCSASLAAFVVLPTRSRTAFGEALDDALTSTADGVGGDRRPGAGPPRRGPAGGRAAAGHRAGDGADPGPAAGAPGRPAPAAPRGAAHRARRGRDGPLRPEPGRHVADAAATRRGRPHWTRPPAGCGTTWTVCGGS